MEQTTFWEEAKKARALGLPLRNQIGLSRPNAAFSCPSDPATPGLHTTHEELAVASSSFLGVNGTNYLAKNGVLFKESHVTYAEITGGLSNTLLAGERPPSVDYWYGWWYGGYGQFGSGSLDTVLGVTEINDTNEDPRPQYLETCPLGPSLFSRGAREQCDTLHFWSHHPGGALFARCDGSVHFEAYSIDANLIRNLAARD